MPSERIEYADAHVLERIAATVIRDLVEQSGRVQMLFEATDQHADAHELCP